MIHILISLLLLVTLFLYCKGGIEEESPLAGRIIAIEAGHEPPPADRPCETNGGGAGTSTFKGSVRLSYPGHPLACPNGTIPEHALTKDIALRVKSLVEAAGGKTVWTRIDEIVPTTEGRARNLEARANRANQAMAEVLLDIHANESSNPADSGYLLIIHCTGADSIREGNTPMPLDSSGCDPDRGTVKFRESLKFARSLDTRLAHLQYKGMAIPKNRETYGADLRVPATAKMPIVLVEVGFMTSKYDMDMLAEDNYRHILAQALFQAVVDFCGRK